MNDDPTDLSELTHPPHHRAEIVFAVASFLIALFLATQWSGQTTWIEGQPLSRQPGLWPLIAIVGMVLFGVGELIACLVRNIRRGGGNVPAEVWLWVKSAEYVIWFMVYVLATPYVGYLASTVIFMTVLALRLGYRGRIVAMAPLLAVCIVVAFKAFLAVRIPGGAVYDIFPQAIRNFLVIYL
ncbi:MAG: tripartite tricarboxylate transporter TctB family protein [Rhodobacteraceae bacterium]|nr:tripartite tricarboxylate transporter TctB family protein [Paracoccaceae bacterium]